MSLTKLVTSSILIFALYGNAFGLGGPYSFKAGHGTVPWLEHFADNGNAVARDWNGDGKTDVMVFPAAHGVYCNQGCPMGFTKSVPPFVFLSNPDGSYSPTRAGGGVASSSTVSEWTELPFSVCSAHYEGWRMLIPFTSFYQYFLSLTSKPRRLLRRDLFFR